MFANLLGGVAGATPAGMGASALSSVAGLASGGPSSADSGSGNFEFGNFSTGDSNKNSKSKAEIYSNTIIKVGAVIGAVITISAFLRK